MQEYHAVKFGEILEGLEKGLKSEILNPASMCKSRPVGINSTIEQRPICRIPQKEHSKHPIYGSTPR